MNIILIFFAGYAVGLLFGVFVFHEKEKKSSGCLVIDFDTDDDNLFSLELYEGVMDVYAKKEVILDVVHSRE